MSISAFYLYRRHQVAKHVFASRQAHMNKIIHHKYRMAQSSQDNIVIDCYFYTNNNHPVIYRIGIKKNKLRYLFITKSIMIISTFLCKTTYCLTHKSGKLLIYLYHLKFAPLQQMIGIAFIYFRMSGCL